ncbi:hypothetical protein OPT61_g7629 [Boeremia exigua]|uniref:Uncharacterized protein n=1 Tax=Boeremia exigua TaxID=749465 RepID=A0ACC2I1S6_9PLEO|nr:hypothetical protein OPT61_g7629 [Boeremia exigua]
MFSAEDAKEVFQLLSSDGDLSNPLILSSRGHGFVTRKYTREAFAAIVTRVDGGSLDQKISVTSLARDLDVSAETVLILAQECEGTILLRSSSGREIISKWQRDAIDHDLETRVLHGLVWKDQFASRYDLSHSSLDRLIEMSKTPINEANGYLYSTSYDLSVSTAIEQILREYLQSLRALNLESTDVEGSPPTWFVHRTINDLLKNEEFAGKFHVHGLPSGVRCTPVQLIHETHDTVINDLKSGKLAYIDIRAFQIDNQAIYTSVDEARTGLESTEGQPVIANFPDSIYAVVLEKVEQTIRSLAPSAHRAGESLLSEDSYSRHRSILLDLAKADAASQWQRFKEDPRAEAKYSLSNTFYQILEDNPVLQNLVKERTLERAIDDAFSARISELEKQNEAEFADYWTDRVVTRIAIYSEGLDAVEDQKLQDQLSDLLAQYIQKDIVADTVTKATAQGLILSRKTRKNIQRLESALRSGSTGVAALTASLEKFNKKQAIDTPDAATLESSKATMLGDMARRMQKQKKSDGPLLFLTLVVFLFAKHNAGVVYATGKFAPKLLKQLKPVLDAEQYAQLEAWKEAARSSSLSAEDRDGMKRMVEAGV